MYDHAAIPDQTLSPNNYDANTWIVGGSVHVKPTKRLAVIVGYSRYFAQERTVTESNFSVTVDPALRAEPHTFTLMLGVPISPPSIASRLRYVANLVPRREHCKN